MSAITARDSTEIFYKDWGKGPAVTFSHGRPLSPDAWDGQRLSGEQRDIQGDQDSLLLRRAAALLHQRNATDVPLPAPGTEFVLLAIAKLLEAIAGSLDSGDQLRYEVHRSALEIARHIHRYIDTYLPTDQQ